MENRLRIGEDGRMLGVSATDCSGFTDHVPMET